MKLIFLTIITIVFSSNLDAKTEELDRNKYFYSCALEMIEDDKCPGLEKGDILWKIDTRWAVMYCDKDHLIFDGNVEPSQTGTVTVTCRYNGEPIKKHKSLGKSFFRGI